MTRVTQLLPRFPSTFGVADYITASNAGLGAAAVLLAPARPELAARLVLVGTVADGLDGVVARRFGGSAVGEHLDSLADVVTFGLAPAVLAFTLARGTVIPGLVGAGYVLMAVSRLALYNAYDADVDHTFGVATTVAGLVIGALVIADVDPVVVVAGAAGLAYLMSYQVQYPDLAFVDLALFGALILATAAVPRPSLAVAVLLVAAIDIATRPLEVPSPFGNVPVLFVLPAIIAAAWLAVMEAAEPAVGAGVLGTGELVVTVAVLGVAAVVRLIVDRRGGSTA